MLQPVLEVGLPKTGYSRTFKRDVVFGPKLYNGMNVMHPFDYQELEHLETILWWANNGSTTGKLIHMSWEALKLELSMPLPLQI